jgi:hypothetical protein
MYRIAAEQKADFVRLLFNSVPAQTRFSYDDLLLPVKNQKYINLNW